MHPDVSLPTRANQAALGRKPTAPKQPVIKPSQIATLVLNGTPAAGLARDTSYKLAVAHFHTNHLPAPLKADAPSASYYSKLRLLRLRPTEREGGRGPGDRRVRPALGERTASTFNVQREAAL